MTEQKQTSIFEDWISQYKALLFKVVRAYAFTTSDRDDLFQEITLQVWRSVPKFREESAVSTWLYRISLNTALKWIKMNPKHSSESIDNMESLLQETDQKHDERLVWLYEEIANLDPIDRSLTLLLLDGFSYKEMSDIIGVSENNIGVKIHRIKKQLITKSKEYDQHGI